MKSYDSEKHGVAGRVKELGEGKKEDRNPNPRFATEGQGGGAVRGAE